MSKLFDIETLHTNCLESGNCRYLSAKRSAENIYKQDQCEMSKMKEKVNDLMYSESVLKNQNKVLSEKVKDKQAHIEMLSKEKKESQAQNEKMMKEQTANKSLVELKRMEKLEKTIQAQGKALIESKKERIESKKESQAQMKMIQTQMERMERMEKTIQALIEQKEESQAQMEKMQLQIDQIMLEKVLLLLKEIGYQSDSRNRIAHVGQLQRIYNGYTLRQKKELWGAIKKKLQDHDLAIDEQASIDTLFVSEMDCDKAVALSLVEEVLSTL